MAVCEAQDQLLWPTSVRIGLDDEPGTRLEAERGWAAPDSPARSVLLAVVGCLIEHLQFQCAQQACRIMNRNEGTTGLYSGGRRGDGMHAALEARFLRRGWRVEVGGECRRSSRKMKQENARINRYRGSLGW
jgi:hypothetical protein